MFSIAIRGVGSYLPEQVVLNDEVADRAGVAPEWIVQKTGIRARHRAASDEAASDLAAEAARRALRQAGLAPERLDYVVVATSTPDHPQPATASIVQHLIGAAGAGAFDLNAVCSGFVYALAVTERLLAGRGGHGYGLVIGVDVYSRIIDRTDRRTAVLFGDGAGAAVLGPGPDRHGMLDTLLLSRGDQHGLVGVPAGGSRMPASAATFRDGLHHFRMDGRGVREFVSDQLPDAVARLLRRARVKADEVDHVIPHQANGVMLAEILPGLGLTTARTHLTVDRFGNTGAASIPITLDAANRAGTLRRGELVLLAGFGGGMTLGMALLRWSGPGPGAASGAAGRTDALHAVADGRVSVSGATVTGRDRELLGMDD